MTVSDEMIEAGVEAWRAASPNLSEVDLPEIYLAMRALDPQVASLEAALEKCRDKFAEYADLHRAKLADCNSPRAQDAIMDKVNRNRDMRDMCDAALATTQKGLAK